MERKKVALLFICLNPHYWPFLKDVVEDCRKHFLTNHQVDFFTWSDIPELGSKKHEEILANTPSQEELNQKIQEASSVHGQGSDQVLGLQKLFPREVIAENINFLRTQDNITIFDTDPIEWPYPTLLRYHLFLQQEEALKDYDYIFYMDVDMRVVNKVDEVILSDGLTMAEHPMYAVAKRFVHPFESNPESAACVKRFGVIIPDPESGNKWFKPLYAAGGFQGGTSTEFLKAMKGMRKTVEADFTKNYIAIWNDESHWNKYLSEYQGPMTVLTPSFVYPDSLIKEYYEPIWGTNHQRGINVYPPIIVTLTKKFSTSKAGGAAVNETLKQLK